MQTITAYIQVQREIKIDVTERIFALLYVSIIGITRCYKNDSFLPRDAAMLARSWES